MSLRRRLHLEFVRDSKRMKHLLIKTVVVTRFASGGFGGEIVKVADDVIDGVQTAVIAKQSVDPLLKRDSFETSVTSNIHGENPIQVTIAPPDGHEKGEEDPLQVAIEEMGDRLAEKQREEDEHRQAAVLSSTLIDPVGSTPKYPEDDPEKALEEDWRRAEVIDIHFDMSRGEDGQLLHPIPEEVLATLPKDSEKRDEILKSMTGECRYYKGPSDREMDLDRFHTSQRPMKLDELDRENPPYFLAHEDAVKLPLMHTVNDIKMTVERNNSMSPELEAQSMDYQLNTTTDLHRADLHESQALIPEFGPHDMRSTLHVPADTKIEYIKSITAPQESKQDNRFNQQAFQGGNHQYLVLSCDTSRCEITESVRLNKSIELDPRGPKYDQITYLDHPRDRFEAYPKNDPEKAWQGQDVALRGMQQTKVDFDQATKDQQDFPRHLDRLTDKQVHAPGPTREEYSSPGPAVNPTEQESPSPSPSLSSPSKVEPELLQEPARRQQIDQGQHNQQPDKLTRQEKVRQVQNHPEQQTQQKQPIQLQKSRLENRPQREQDRYAHERPAIPAQPAQEQNRRQQDQQLRPEKSQQQPRQEQERTRESQEAQKKLPQQQVELAKRQQEHQKHSPQEQRSGQQQTQREQAARLEQQPQQEQHSRHQAQQGQQAQQERTQQRVEAQRRLLQQQAELPKRQREQQTRQPDLQKQTQRKDLEQTRRPQLTQKQSQTPKEQQALQRREQQRAEAQRRLLQQQAKQGKTKR